MKYYSGLSTTEDDFTGRVLQIDPVKEVEAAQKRLEIRVSTLAQETMQLNGGI
jgi:hypothetical protein